MSRSRKNSPERHSDGQTYCVCVCVVVAVVAVVAVVEFVLNSKNLRHPVIKYLTPVSIEKVYHNGALLLLIMLLLL